MRVGAVGASYNFSSFPLDLIALILFGFHLFGVGTGWDMAFLTYPVDQVGPVGVFGVFKMENGQNGD